MARFLVSIDVDRVRQSLSAADRRPVTIAEVETFLLDSGFARVYDAQRWVVEERDLGAVDASEVASIEPAPEDLPDSPPAAVHSVLAADAAPIHTDKRIRSAFS
jgi:hypothetical protein